MALLNVFRALPPVLSLALAFFLCAGFSVARAQAPEADVPDALKPWKNWVLHGQEARLCPEVAGEHKIDFCAWPGELRLDAREGGARFTQTWETLRESAVPLPGNREYWPQQVTVNGRPHAVSRRGGRMGDMPVVWLPPGRHVVAGWIPWLERPGKLSVPANVALIALSVDGKAVQAPERDDISLMLSASGETARARESDSLGVQVYRKLTDGIPARLTTRVRLKVSGKPREVAVADILPEHFVPTGIVSLWTARLDQEGRLLVQALPGEATVEVMARLDEPLEEVAPRLSPQRAQEVWSYEAVPALRTTTILPVAGGEAFVVDPLQAGVPGDWRSLPALAVGEGARLRVEEHARGQDERENQRLTLRREMWLDFSGKGFFARDRIEGSMRQGWRFDVARPYTLVSANQDARAVANAADDLGLAGDLLVTRGADESLTGVEWRRERVTLNAGVRLEAVAGARIPVTGWRQTFDSVETTLHLPYGYRLLAAPGVDTVSRNAWVERWTMLDIFLAAFFALLAWRLFGAGGGVAAAAYLILAMQEPMSPVFSFAAAVILVLLHRFMPEGRLRGFFRLGQYLALICLAVAAVIFIPAQIRHALYPQLEERAGEDALLVDDMAHAAVDGNFWWGEDIATKLAEPWAAAAPPPPESSEDRYSGLSALRRRTEENLMPSESLSRIARPSHQSGWRASVIEREKAALPARQRYAQSTVTQTGGGEPAWNLGEQYRLRWAGPVAETQRVQLFVSPPWLTRILRVLMVVLLGALVWRLLRAVFPDKAPPPGWRRAPPAAASARAASLAGAGLAVLFVAALGFPASAAAAPAGAFPPKELLDELRTRLLKAPECAPFCVDVAKARVEARPRALRVRLTAHAAAPSSLPLPNPGRHLDLREVRVDDTPHPVLRFGGRIYVVLRQGIHRVQIEYAPSGDTVSLSFPLRPARIEFAGTGWQVEGIDENRLLGETLNFSRAADAPVSAAERGAQAQQFAPFVHVRRDIDLDLDWSVNTTVRRLAPAEGGFTFPIPLLAGEHVTMPAVKVREGRAWAVFTAQTPNASWTSRLDKAETLELIAPALSERAETWRITVNPSWHLEWNGVPVTLVDDGRDQAAFEFNPLPGEKLSLRVTRPAKVEGGFLAIDHAILRSHIGRHASDYELEFSLRASRGGEHRIGLPPELEVLDVRHGGIPLNLQARENHLSLPVSPGKRTYTLKLRRPGDTGLLTSSPAIDLGLPAANINLRTALGEQRWILATSGPAVGPALLYWGELLVALAVAFLLARSGWSSLGRREWFLLVLGFSTFSWPTLLLIALWLIVIDWRVRASACANWPPLKFNAMQAGILALTALMLRALIEAAPRALLSVPDMGIRGPGSGAGILNWFVDQGGPVLPVATVFSLPIWVYRLLMLAWALWLAYTLIRWLGRGLTAWLRHGYWKKISWQWRRTQTEPAAASEKSAPSRKRGKPPES
jgi:hypothetical protein